MKRITITVLALAVILGIGGCKKDITLNPSSGVLIDQYFYNVKDITASLAGIYSAFQEEMEGDGSGKDEGYGGRYHYWGDVRTENYTGSTYATYNQTEMATNTIEFANSASDWAGLYKVVSRTNLAIKYYPQVLASDPNATPTVVNNALAQAYAMRAEAYFYIVRVWGDAPKWTEPYTDITVSGSKPQTKALTLIDSLIIPDLTKAYGLIQRGQTPVVWNINEGAICAMLADVYMWRATIPTGGGGGTTDWNNALTWYANLLKAKSPTGTYYGGTSTGSAPAITTLETGANWKNNFLTPSNSLETIWSIYWDYTVNGCACIPVFVALSNNTVQHDVGFINTWKKNYKTDIRVAKSVDTLPGLNHVNMLYKYYNLSPTTAGITPVAGNLNFNVYLPMYRLADVYLSMAEAYAQLGDVTNSLKYFNFVYLRARNAATTPTTVGITAAQAPNTSALLDYILQEESWESLGEGKRWFDLIRTNRVHANLDNVLNVRNATTTTVGSTTVITPDTKGFADAPNRYYWPVSQNALNANKLLHQNPGY